MIRTSFLKTSLIAASLAIASSTTTAANLVIDGDFSSTAFTGPFSNQTGYTAFLTGSTFGSWTVLAGSVDRIVSLWNAPISGNTIDLNGNAPGSIGQLLNLTPASYELSFFLSGNPAGTPLTKSIRVQVGSASQDFTYTLPTGTTTQNPPFTLAYIPITLAFTSSGTTQLRFTSLDTNSSLWGAVIGNVVVTAVPEPASSLLLLLGISGLFAFRKQSKSRHRKIRYIEAQSTKVS